MATAEAHRLYVPAARTPHVQRADALRAVQLMSGERNEICRNSADVERDFSGGLRGVGVKHDTALTTNFTNGRNIGDHADLVVGVHKRRQHGVVPKRSAHFLNCEVTILVRRQIRHGEAFLLQALARIEHSFVLDLRRHEMPSAARVGTRNAENRQVYGLRGAGGENNLIRLCTDQDRNVSSCTLNVHRSASAKNMSS